MRQNKARKRARATATRAMGRRSRSRAVRDPGEGVSVSGAMGRLLA
jgi:hypothetical protein